VERGLGLLDLLPPMNHESSPQVQALKLLERRVYFDTQAGLSFLATETGGFSVQKE
jgi:hypothetical protein